MAPMKKGRQFASDNYAGICPEAFAALEEANDQHAGSYGHDPWTRKASSLIRDIFETDCQVFFVFNGTAANSLAISSLCRSYHGILCHETAHVETDECGAPEFFSGGAKVLLLPGENGKIEPASIDRLARRRSDVHYPKPRVVSLTQATELGTVYTPGELKEIGAMSRKLKLRLHMDGARFPNAAASLGVAPKELSWRAGVEALCFGGTKNGIALGETVVFFKRELADEFEYRRKQAGQLASKMRFLAAPWVGMLSDGAWLRHAAHANRMAQKLKQELEKVTGVNILFPCQANAVFAELPVPAIEALWKLGWMFYIFIGPGGCRLMCSWDTTDEDIQAFVADLKAVMSRLPRAALSRNGRPESAGYGGRSSRSIAR